MLAVAVEVPLLQTASCWLGRQFWLSLETCSGTVESHSVYLVAYLLLSHYYCPQDLTCSKEGASRQLGMRRRSKRTAKRALLPGHEQCEVWPRSLPP